MKKRVVSKFGGTSMADAECMLRSARISIQQGSFLTVVSATSGTTNQLIAISLSAEKGQWDSAHQEIEKLKLKHIQIAKDLQCSSDQLAKLQEMFFELESLSRGIYLLKDCSTKALDAVQSLGERISSLLFAQSLQQELDKQGVSGRAVWIDARNFIKTDDYFGKARPLTDEIHKGCLSLLQKQNEGDYYVTQGFIGSTLDGLTTTLGRGGSDYSAALFAEGLSADVLEIWTDVPGIATTDPRVVPQAQLIPLISFQEASELATFGAKILHPATLLPAVRKNIQTFVGSSFEGTVRGTWIQKQVQDQPLVRAMATRKGQILVTLTNPAMAYASGFLTEIFKVISQHKVSVDAITTSEISVSFTLDANVAQNKRLFQDLGQLAEIQVEERLAMVSLIGNNINHTPGLAKKVFSIIADINVRMICLGASKHNFCIIVEEDKADEAIRKLHKDLIEGPRASS